MSATIVVEPEIYTEADLLSLSQQGYRFELIEGELKTMSPAGGGHGYRTQKLGARATVWAEDHDLGICFTAETGFRIEKGKTTVLAPDFAFIAKSRVPNPIPEKFLTTVPDLVLETRSPGDRALEIADKIERWLKAGVKIVWELNPRRKQLTVYRSDKAARILGPDDVLDGEDVLPGFTLNLSAIF